MLIEAVESYLATRRALGFALRQQQYLLCSYARFAAERQEAHVRTETAIAWAALGSSPEDRDCRLKTVVRFARYMRAEDERHEMPPDGVFGHQGRRRPTPYIFSPADVRRLVEEASRLGPAGSLRPHTSSTLFGLLAVTGLRISEALNLRLDDLTSEGLVIRETKFRKSRLVPIHGTTDAALERYLVHRNRVGGVDRLFVSPRGRPLRYNKVLAIFHRLVDALGLSSAKPKPRIHSLRHTFAVRALENCPDGRDHIGRHMLALSTYLGHASISNTYWYLQATPQLMSDITGLCETFAQGRVP